MYTNEQYEIPAVQVDLEGDTLWQFGDDSQIDEFPDLTALLEE